MRLTLFDRDGQIAHTSATLRGIRRHVHKDNVKRAARMGNGKILFITLKDDSYFQVSFKTTQELDATLGRWRNLKSVKVTTQ